MPASTVTPTLRAVLESTTVALHALGEQARREAETLVFSALAIPRSRAITDPDWPVPEALALRVQREQEQKQRDEARKRR